MNEHMSYNPNAKMRKSSKVNKAIKKVLLF